MDTGVFKPVFFGMHCAALLIQFHFSFIGRRHCQVIFTGSQGYPSITGVVQPLEYHAALTPYPIHFACPNCHNNVTRSLKYVLGNQSWIAAAALYFFAYEIKLSWYIIFTLLGMK